MRIQGQVGFSLLLGLSLLSMGLVQAQEVDLRAMLRGSPAYQGLRLQKDKAQASLQASQAALMPTLAPQGIYSRNTLGQETLTLGLGGSVALLPWGTAQEALYQARRSYQAALLNLRSQENSLFQTVLSQYLAVYLGLKDLELAQKRLELRNAQLLVVQAQRDRGQATFQDLLEAEGNVLQAQADASQAEIDLSLAKARLQSTLGKDVKISPLPLPGSLPSLETVLASRDRRPDVAQARLTLAEAEEELLRARQERFLPQLNLSLGVQGGGGPLLSLGLNLASGTMSYSAQYAFQPVGSGGISLQAQAAFPLFSPAQDADLLLKEKEVEEARFSLETTLRNADLDLRAKYQALLQAQKQVEVATGNLRVAENALQVAQNRLEAGTGTRLEVLQAETNLLQAHRTLEGAKAAFLQAYYALLDAMGEPLLGGEE